MSDATRIAGPERIGKYRIDCVVGSGAMGVVYRGYDSQLERRVAIKTIRRDLLSSADGESWRQRFEREVRLAARCLHPNLVTVFDFGEENDVPYIVMEYVAGRPLHQVLDEGRFEIDAAASVASQVLLALEEAHGAGIVHRDIKPANVILLDNAMAKVTDFGIARLDMSDLTAHGSVVGTPSYMSPEQFLGEEVDARSDLFSTGVILYEMVCGQRPFKGRSNAELLYRIANENPEPPDVLNPEVPPQLAAVILRALEKRPERRFESARAFARAIATSGAEPTAATLLTPPGAAARRPLPGGFDAEVLARLERELARHIGPIAKLVIRRSAEQATSEEELRAMLVESIGERAAAEAFRRTLSRTQLSSNAPLRSRPTGSGSVGQQVVLAPEELAETQRSLTSLVGPVARILIDRAALRARSHEEFFRTLAESIPSETERRQFLKKHLSGPL